jgi:exodeoxyribonuclease-3
MKIIAWNVNGIRSLLKTTYLDNLIKDENPDVFCMGETKISCPYDDVEANIATRLPQFKYRYWSPCKTKGGYSGTAIFCKKEPTSIKYGLPLNKASKKTNVVHEDIDEEGRVIAIEYSKFYLVHVYTPNSGQALARLDWRTKVWDRAFEEYIISLKKSKPVIVCGDLNVARNPIDLKNPKTNLRTAGYTDEERISFEKLLTNTELIDSFRQLHPEKIQYSYWSYMRNSRVKNIGWRIDYFLIDPKIKTKIKSSEILEKVLGSDHAPVKLEIGK